VWVPEAYRPD